MGGVGPRHDHCNDFVVAVLLQLPYLLHTTPHMFLCGFRLCGIFWVVSLESSQAIQNRWCNSICQRSQFNHGCSGSLASRLHGQSSSVRQCSIAPRVQRSVRSNLGLNWLRRQFTGQFFGAHAVSTTRSTVAPLENVSPWPAAGVFCLW